MCKVLSRISPLVLTQTFTQTGKNHGENFPAKQPPSRGHSLSCFSPAPYQSTFLSLSLCSRKNSPSALKKNYSHCDILSLLGVSWLASSPERGADALVFSAHFNSCECLITFLFKNNSHLACHYFYHLPPKLDQPVCMSLLLLPCPRGGLQPQTLLYLLGMPNLRILGYQWIQPNAKP